MKARCSSCILAVLAVGVSLAVSPVVAHAQRPAYELDSLLVSVGARASEMARSGRAFEVITRERIAATPAKTLIDLLRWSNGVDLRDRSPAQADISIRGAGFEEVLVLVDGVRRSDAQTGHFDLDLAIPIDRIERIEILRGPASAIYGGDAVGGVINVVTREMASGIGTRVEGGSFGSGAGGIVGATRAGGWTLNGGAELSQSDGDRPGTDFESAVVEGSAARVFSSGRVVLEAGYARRDFGAADFYAPIPAFEKTRTTNGALRWSGALSDALGLQARVSARRHEDEFIFFRDDPSAGANQHDANEVGAEVIARWSGNSALNFVAGGEIYEESLESSNLGDRGQTRGALFAEAAILSGEGDISLTLGLRGDAHDAYDAFLSPSASASFRASDALSFRASLDRSFRPPTWTERFYSDPFHQASSEINPEKAWSVEGGAEYRSQNGWSISSSLFKRYSEDLIDWAKPEIAIPEIKWMTRNVETADFLGFELDLTAEDLLGARWSLGFSALDLETEEEGGYFSKSALRPERRRVSLQVDRRFGPVSLGFMALVADRIQSDSYGRVDLRGAVDAGRGQFYLDITNLTDESHLDISGAIVPGIGFVAGYRIGLSAPGV